uniref:Uncharacterized protein n=1 Tax=Timema cristinae TaxID=61476 RepID=A0A7R9GTV1_TIMCR|nr:unnamed protein product [Timema cristinae]
MWLVQDEEETILSRGKSGSFHIALAPVRGLDSRCMISSKRQEPICYRRLFCEDTLYKADNEKVTQGSDFILD